MSGMMLHGMGDCTTEFNCGCGGPAERVGRPLGARRQRDLARAELVRVHTDVWAATTEVQRMGYDGETAARMVRAALLGADTGVSS